MTWRAQLAAIRSGDDCQMFGGARGPCAVVCQRWWLVGIS